MRGVAGNDQHERLYRPLTLLLRIRQQVHLGFLVHTHAVHQLDALQLLRAVRRGVEVLLGHDGRLLDEPVFDGPCERIVHHHILEWHGLAARRLGERRSRQFQAQHRLQLVQCPHACTRAVTVRLVHQQHQVGQAGQVVKVAFAEVLRQALDAGCLAATNLGVDLRDVEDVDLHGRVDGLRHQVAPLLVGLAGDDLGRRRCELGDAFEHVLRCVRREVADQLVVDREVRREHEKVLVAIRRVKIADERAHEPRLADAGCQREAKRGEVSLEVGQFRELALQRINHRLQVFRRPGAVVA